MPLWAGKNVVGFMFDRIVVIIVCYEDRGIKSQMSANWGQMKLFLHTRPGFP